MTSCSRHGSPKKTASLCRSTTANRRSLTWELNCPGGPTDLLTPEAVFRVDRPRRQRPESRA